MHNFKIREAVIFGGFLWMLLFVTNAIIVQYPGIINNCCLADIISYIFTGVIATGVAILFFQTNVADWSNGLTLGAVFVVSVLVLDILITFPLLRADTVELFSIQAFIQYLIMIAFAEFAALIPRYSRKI